MKASILTNISHIAEFLSCLSIVQDHRDLSNKLGRTVSIHINGCIIYGGSSKNSEIELGKRKIIVIFLIPLQARAGEARAAGFMARYYPSDFLLFARNARARAAQAASCARAAIKLGFEEKEMHTFDAQFWTVFFRSSGTANITTMACTRCSILDGFYL